MVLVGKMLRLAETLRCHHLPKYGTEQEMLSMCCFPRRIYPEQTTNSPLLHSEGQVLRWANCIIWITCIRYRGPLLILLDDTAVRAIISMPSYLEALLFLLPYRP